MKEEGGRDPGRENFVPLEKVKRSGTLPGETFKQVAMSNHAKGENYSRVFFVFHFIARRLSRAKIKKKERSQTAYTKKSEELKSRSDLREIGIALFAF